MEEEVHSLTRQLLEIVKAPDPDPQDPSTFKFVKKLVPVSPIVYNLVGLSADADEAPAPVETSLVPLVEDEVDEPFDAYLNDDMDEMDEEDCHVDEENREDREVDLTGSSPPSSPTTPVISRKRIRNTRLARLSGGS